MSKSRQTIVTYHLPADKSWTTQTYHWKSPDCVDTPKSYNDLNIYDRYEKDREISLANKQKNLNSNGYLNTDFKRSFQNNIETLHEKYESHVKLPTNNNSTFYSNTNLSKKNDNLGKVIELPVHTSSSSTFYSSTNLSKKNDNLDKVIELPVYTTKSSNTNLNQANSDFVNLGKAKEKPVQKTVSSNSNSNKYVNGNYRKNLDTLYENDAELPFTYLSSTSNSHINTIRPSINQTNQQTNVDTSKKSERIRVLPVHINSSSSSYSSSSAPNITNLSDHTYKKYEFNRVSPTRVNSNFDSSFNKSTDYSNKVSSTDNKDLVNPNTLSGVYFNGNSFGLLTDKLQIKDSFDVLFQFSTSKADGILMIVVDSISNNSFFIELVDSQLKATLFIDGEPDSTWSDLPNNLLNNNTWIDVNIKIIGSRIEMKVKNKNFIKTHRNILKSAIIGDLFVAGHPSSVKQPYAVRSKRFYVGEMRNFKVNKQSIYWYNTYNI